MTALNFLLFDDVVDVVTDTLCTAGPEKKPYIFTTKLHPVPHLNGLFTHTGQGLFAIECLKALLVEVIAGDVVEANEDLPSIFRGLWDRHVELCKSQGQDVSGSKTTNYLFGWDASAGRMIGLDYQADNGFEPNRIKDGCWMHPNTVPDIVVRQPGDLLRITLKQKAIDDTLPPEMRAGIGGELHFAKLRRRNCSIETVHRFSDADDQLKEMLRACAPAVDGGPSNVML